VISDVVAESRRSFAVEHHQFRQTGQIADSFLEAGDRLFGLYDGCVLVPQYIRPEPAIECFLVGLQNVLAQSKTGVKKRLVVFVGDVEILNQPQ
jgi:hypothetical protein